MVGHGDFLIAEFRIYTDFLFSCIDIAFNFFVSLGILIRIYGHLKKIFPVFCLQERAGHSTLIERNRDLRNNADVVLSDVRNSGNDNVLSSYQVPGALLSCCCGIQFGENSHFFLLYFLVAVSISSHQVSDFQSL